MNPSYFGFGYSIRVPTQGYTCDHASQAEDPLTREIYCAVCGTVLSGPPITVAYVSARERRPSHLTRHAGIKRWALGQVAGGRSLGSVTRELRRKGVAITAMTVFNWSRRAGISLAGRWRGGSAGSGPCPRPCGGSPDAQRARLRAEARLIAERLARRVGGSGP